GPQRDDLRLMLDGQLAASHGSEGQQRGLVLALRFAGWAQIFAGLVVDFWSIYQQNHCRWICPECPTCSAVYEKWNFGCVTKLFVATLKNASCRILERVFWCWTRKYSDFCG
ncbi:MAG: hypothetical protein AAGA97_09675, partial [Pseudomonadota bacterium]